jgi:hypothetical protein
VAPIHLLPLIEIYCSPAAENCPHVKIVQGSFRPIEELMDMGLIEVSEEPHDGEYHGLQVTDKGRAYVDAVTSVPLPVQKWTVPCELNNHRE